MGNGVDPFYDNPRWNATRTTKAFRDNMGFLHYFSNEDLAFARDDRLAAPTVRREFILGKALSVFLPIPPMAPVARIGLIH